MPLDPTQAPLVNTDIIKHSLAEGLVAQGAGDPAIFRDMIDPETGNLKPLTTANGEAMTNKLDSYLGQFGIDMNTALDGYKEYYEHSTHQAPN